MIQLNPTVGVAPGTTTMTLGGLGCPFGDCPPDEALHYVQPPQVQAGYPSGVTPSDGTIPTPSYWNPYTDPPQLKGLGQTEMPRWGIILFAGLATFAVVFGAHYLRRRKR